MIHKSERYQYYATFCVNLMSISYGTLCGWPSASFLILQSDESPLENGPMTNEEASWVGSILCIGGLVGNLVYAWIANKVGAKIAMLLLSVPLIMSWVIIIFAQNVFHLCISRFMGGLTGGGTFALVPIYITEISEDRIRGSLGSYLVLSCNVGVLIAFIIGNYLPYKIIPYIFLILPIIFILTLSFVPETPQRLLKIRKIEEAENSLRYFRNLRKESQLPDKFIMEIEKLKNEVLNPITDKIKNNENNLTWNDFNNRQAKKAFIIGIALMALNQFCGCFAMINYTATIFKQSGSNLSPNMSAIIVGFIQFLGAYISTLLVDRLGRKLMMSISSIGTGMGLCCLGFYMNLILLNYDVSNFQWVPVASFSFLIFAGSCGVITLPFLLLSEILSPKIRYTVCTTCMTILWIFAFLMVKYLSTLIDILGMHGTMYFFATCCFAGVIFVMTFVPETKGKSVDLILSTL